MAGSQTDLTRLVVSLEARLDKYDKAMAKAAATTNKTLGQMEGRFSRAEKKLSGFGDRVFSGFSAVAALAGLKRLITDIGNLGEEAKKAGISVENLQRFIFAGLGQGVSRDQLVQAFAKLNLELGEAATKGNDLSKILEASGVSVKSLGHDTAGAFLKIADLFKSAKNAQDAALLGQAGFGKGFRDLIPLLSQGGEAIRSKMAEAVVVSDALVKKFDDALDRILELGTNWKAGIGTQLLSSVKEIERIVDAAVRLQKALAGAGEEDPLGKLVEGAATATRELLGLEPLLRKPPREHHPKSHQPDDPQLVVPKALTEEQKKSAREADRQAEAILKVIENLKLETAQLSRTDREQAIYNELAKAGVDINSKNGRTIADLTGEFYDQQTALQNLTDELDFARDATKGFFSDLISGLREGASLTDTLSKAFGNLADKMIDKLLDQTIDALLGKSGTAGGGIVEQLISGITKGVTAPGALPRITGPGAGLSAGSVLGGIAPIIPVTGRRISPGTLLPNVGTPITGRELTSATSALTKSSNSLLDLIARAEGTAGQPGGGFNTSLGFGRFLPGGKEQNLTGMTLDQIRAVQSQILNNPKNLTGASPVGRYQITRSTLDDLRAKLGLTGKETFDPAMQDRLATQLAQDRFAAGGIPGLKSTWVGLRDRGVPDPQIAQAIEQSGQQFAGSVEKIAATTQTAATGFEGGFAPALEKIIGAVGGGPGGGGILASILSMFGGSSTYATRAAGGIVRGPGTSTSDSIPTLLSNGEFVVNAAASKKWEELLKRINAGAIPHLAKGGFPNVQMPRVPSLVIPQARGGGSQRVEVNVRAHPSKYLFLETDNRAAAGDQRTLGSARRNFPETQARYLKLGTTGR